MLTKIAVTIVLHTNRASGFATISRRCRDRHHRRDLPPPRLSAPGWSAEVISCCVNPTVVSMRLVSNDSIAGKSRSVAFAESEVSVFEHWCFLQLRVVDVKTPSLESREPMRTTHSQPCFLGRQLTMRDSNLDSLRNPRNIPFDPQS